MDYKTVDEGLIKRGELLLSLDFLEGYGHELGSMSDGKVGRPFKLTERCIEFLTVVRYLFSMPCREVEGFSRALSRLIHKLPCVDYSWLRKRILRLNLSPYEALMASYKHIAIAVDSTGVRVQRAGGWVSAMEIITDDTHDSKVMPKLICEAENHGRILKTYMDGSYDSSSTYELLEAEGMDAVIKPRKNSRLNTKSEARMRAIALYRRIGDEAWSKLREYGKRWSIETAYSTFKRLFGKSSMAKTMENIANELEAKASIYNMPINLKLSKEKRQS